MTYNKELLEKHLERIAVRDITTITDSEAEAISNVLFLLAVDYYDCTYECAEDIYSAFIDFRENVRKDPVNYDYDCMEYFIAVCLENDLMCSENYLDDGKSYSIVHNDKYNSEEVIFFEKPSEAVRNALKSLRFRWNKKTGLWYGFAEPAEISAAIDSADAPAAVEPSPVKSPEPEPVASVPAIKFYYNGIKLNGGKLIKCSYSVDNRHDNMECVSIYCHDHSGNLPRNIFDVENDTDVYTDYFDDDHTTVFPDHPLYKFARYAALKYRARNDEKFIEHLKKELSGPRADIWPGHRESLERDLKLREKQIAEFKAMKNPGHPSNTDLLKIDHLNTERENARKQAEHEEELLRRENFLNDRNYGRLFIKSAVKKFPIIPGFPSVTVRWSEDPYFYSYSDNELILSVPAAERIFKTFDTLRSSEQRYFKTSFLINYIDPETGENCTYEGRYDLGDNDGGLFEHIKSFGQWYTEHSYNGSPLNLNNPDDLESYTRGNKIINFSNWLKNSGYSVEA